MSRKESQRTVEVRLFSAAYFLLEMVLYKHVLETHNNTPSEAALLTIRNIKSNSSRISKIAPLAANYLHLPTEEIIARCEYSEAHAKYLSTEYKVKIAYHPWTKVLQSENNSLILMRSFQLLSDSTFYREGDSINLSEQERRMKYLHLYLHQANHDAIKQNEAFFVDLRDLLMTPYRFVRDIKGQCNSPSINF